MQYVTRWVLLGSLAVAAVAFADGADGVLNLSVKVGETQSVDVGPAIGLFCDDLSIAKIEMKAGTETDNRLQVTGVKPGSTLCRVGSDQLGYKRFVQITVTTGDGGKAAPDGGSKH
jgi:hypothetical protein